MELGNSLWISICTVSVGKIPLDQPSYTEQISARFYTRIYFFISILFILYRLNILGLSLILLCSATLCFDSNLKSMLSNNIK